MRAAAALLVLPLIAALSACSRQADPPAAAPIALDCARGFAAIAGDLAADNRLTPTTEQGEPYIYYNTHGGGPSYVVTQDGAPGHPAILKQEAAQIDGRTSMLTTGCPFGDREGYAQVLAYLQGLKK